MLDLARLVALAAALWACARPRYALGAAVGVGLASLFVAEMVLPFLDRAALQADPGSALGAIFLGPSTLRIAPSPSSVTWLAQHRWLATALEGLAAAAVSRAAFRRARPLRPEDDVARAWDRAGLRFLLVGVLQGLCLAQTVLVDRMVAASSP